MFGRSVVGAANHVLLSHRELLTSIREVCHCGKGPDTSRKYHLAKRPTKRPKAPIISVADVACEIGLPRG